VLAAVLGLAATPAARAENSIERQVAKVLGQARSYQAVMDIKESGTGTTPGDSTFHMVEIVVRHGKVAEMYTTFKADGQTIEMAIKGDRICVSTAGHWQCESGGPQFATLLKVTPEQLLKDLGLHVVYKPAGTRVIAGQPVVGYAFAATVSSTAETGTFWLDPSRQRLVAMDAAATDKVAGKASSLSMKAVFTHWNDPGLKIPAIPGL
jgi:hypothetical protein